MIAAATPQQVSSILDVDLWRATPGRDEEFDEQRFGAWLEMLSGVEEDMAARIVAAIDPTVAIAGLSRYVRVFDKAVLAPIESDDDVDVPPYGGLECEVGGYVVRAKTPYAWDAIESLLLTLVNARPDFFHTVMQGCRRLSNSTPERDELDELMLAPDQQLHDVSVDREGRRSQQGYLTAGDARAFLRMTRQSRPASTEGVTAINAIVAAYFRALDDEARAVEERARTEDRSAAASTDPEVAASIDAVVAVLSENGAAPLRQRALPGPVTADAERVTPLEPLMEYIHDTDPAAYFARSREIAFLANALLAGCAVQSRAFTVQEAWNAAVGVCNLGLEVSPARSPEPASDALRLASLAQGKLPDAFLVDHDLVTAFEAGWRLLHEDVSMFVAGRLIAALADLHVADDETRRDLSRLRRELKRNRAAGTPWRTGDALDVIGILDMPTCVSVRGLLGECPVLPDTLTATLRGHARAVSATAFTCFTTRSQIAMVHEFGATLRDALAS